MMRKTIKLNVLLVLGLSLGLGCKGCGDEPDENGDNNGGSTVDMGGTEMDVGDPDGGAPDDTGALEPGPAFLALQMAPGRETYPTGIRVLPEVEVFDSNAEPMPDAQFEITVEPAGAASEVDGRWEIGQEGRVTFRACALEAAFDGSQVCGTDTLVVNDGPPVVTITSPLPGAQLDAVADPVIVVTGTATDTYGTPSVFVNGAAVQLDPDGSFSAEVAPRFGLNHIEVSASDGLDAKTSYAALDVQWAREYRDASGDPPVEFDDAVTLRLGQLFMDDRMRVSTAPDGTIVTQDLADILELVLKNVDLLGLVPDPVVDSSGLYLRVPSISVGKPTIVIDITDTGIEIFLQITDLQATTEGLATLDTQMLDLNGSITAAMSALVTLEVSKPSAADPVSVTVSGLSVAVEDATANFASAEANALFTLAQSVLRSTLESLLEDTLSGAFVDQLPALLSEVFTTLDDVLADQSFPLDTGLGQPVTINVDGQIQTMSSVFRDNLSAHLSLTASTDTRGVHADSRGVGLLEPNAISPVLFQAGRIQFALRFAMINALLHALWDAGLLEADVTEFVPINADRAVLSARLPPVIRPALLGEPNDFVIELGQVEIETELLGRTDRYGLSLSTGVDIGLANGALVVAFGDTPQVRTWLISTSADQAFLTPEALESLIHSQVWPQFTAALSGGLSLPLPAPDLSGLGAIAAPLAGLLLEFQEVLPASLREGYIVLDANLVGTLSP